MACSDALNVCNCLQMFAFWVADGLAVTMENSCDFDLSIGLGGSAGPVLYVLDSVLRCLGVKKKMFGSNGVMVLVTMVGWDFLLFFWNFCFCFCFCGIFSWWLLW